MVNTINCGTTARWRTNYLSQFMRLLMAICFAFLIAPVYAADTYVVSTQVYFSPNGGAQDAVVKEIGNAKKSIFVQAYSFTNQPIAKALVEAQRRGVSVFVILDKSNRTAKYSAGDFTDHFGIDTYIDDKHAIAHNKIMIIDKETVITGSYNFTKAAENSNAENLLIIRSSQLADLYFGNWADHQKHSVVYQGRDR